GTVIGNITGEDFDGPDPLTFYCDTDATKELVSLSPPRRLTNSSSIVDIILKTQLDRDYAPNMRTLYFSISDGASSIPVLIKLYILDVNDVAPQFVNLPYEVTIKEDAQANTVVYSGVSVVDPDTARVEISMEATDEEYKTTFIINPFTGHITLNRTLDYEKHSYYQFKIMAVDQGGLKADPASFVVYVLDVQDTAPIFVNLPYSEQTYENATVGKSILKVVAVDGDKGIPNNITYSFESGDYSNFNIDPTTGVITVKSSLDRDSEAMRNNGGVYAMIVKVIWLSIYVIQMKAAEVVPPGQVNKGNTTALTLVTITVLDVNDNAPTFSQTNYNATILENMPQGVPISLIGNIMRVFDIDQGDNSHFAVSLEMKGASYFDFSPLPQEIYSESAVLIRVNTSDALDYEKNQRLIFQVVAREINTVERRSSTSTVTLEIEDMNDNAPVFNQTDYSLSVYENAALDASLYQFMASDLDSGNYKEIQFFLKGGSGRFRIEPKTGILRVAGSIDREEINQFFLTVEARDGGGLRTPAEVTMTVLDVNDKRPVFMRDDYYGIIKERSFQFLRPLKVEAFDEDEANTNNSLVSYRIQKTPPNLSTNFTIDNKTGVITITSPLDYEKLDKSLAGLVTLIIEAYDAGIPSLSSQVIVNVTVEVGSKINQYVLLVIMKPPLLNYYLLMFTGFLVITVNASDFDGTSPNNEFIYRIESGALDKFRINFQTGAVEVEKGADLDRESKEIYTLTISAIDRGTPPLTGNCSLKITLTDVNDEAPIFRFSSRSVEVSENSNKDSPVFLYDATDMDLNNKLQYGIGEIMYTKEKNDDRLSATGTAVKYYFGISPSTGQVYVNNSLDRETASKVILQVIAEDTKAEIGKQTATATLTVTILDYNDNPPKFLPSAVYRTSVNEAENVMSIILQVSATDADESQTVTFSIGTTTTDAFAVSSDGTVQLKARLDREKSDTEVFQIIARDNGSPQLSSSATVTVTVLDDNDNSPIFEPHNNSFAVLENVAVGYFVTRLKATDKDIGDYGTVYYTLEGSDNDGSFAIAEKTGDISVARALDRESKAFFRLEVVAKDSKSNLDQQRVTRSDTITINITDVDDNPPKFTSVIPEKPAVPENSNLTFIVAIVSADDADDKTTDNGRIIFSLTTDTNATNGSGVNLFKVNQSTGVITPSVFLNGLSGIYYITVMATNNAQIFNATKRIFIEIIDVNDHIPKFTRPNIDNAVIYVPENSERGTSVFQLEATDEDAGSNGVVHFSIVSMNSDKDGSRVFAVDKVTGLITTTADINAEIQNHYELKLEARDLGIPIPFIATVTMVILVQDKNDHKPEFVGYKVPYPIGIVENQLVCTNVSLAIDRDVNMNFSIICYYLVGSSLLDTFILDKPSGMLCTNTTLDRESTPYVNIVIQALDDCYKTDVVTDKIYPFENGQLYPLMYRPTYTDKLWLEIQVQDVNDNAPSFKSKEMTLGVTRVTQFGKFFLFQNCLLVLQDDVEDKDTERWGVDFFNATSPFRAYPDVLKNELEGLGVTEPFKLFNNGSLKTNMYFKPQMSGFFMVDLQVTDKGGLSDTARLRISLINDDQRLIVVFRRTIDTVGPIKDIIVSALSNKIGVRIVVDSIQTHQTDTGQADLAKTDLFIHGEDYKTNEVIPALRLLSMIDQKNAQLITLLNEYNVLQIVPAQQDKVDNSVEEKLKMAVILISVVLGLICIVLAIVLFYVHRRYQRKLKAATAMAYTPSDSDLYKADIPGTQINSFENANPIFLEKIMLDRRDDG
ncbi:unnamed protein product, partial [Lymnaea stagnalis]